jgi:hypothetical protein
MLARVHSQVGDSKSDQLLNSFLISMVCKMQTHCHPIDSLFQRSRPWLGPSACTMTPVSSLPLLGNWHRLSWYAQHYDIKHISLREEDSMFMVWGFLWDTKFSCYLIIAAITHHWALIHKIKTPCHLNLNLIYQEVAMGTLEFTSISIMQSSGLELSLDRA